MYRNNKTVTVEPTPLDLADYLLGKIKGSELITTDERRQRKLKICYNPDTISACPERIQALMLDHFKRFPKCELSSALAKKPVGDFTWLGSQYFVTITVMPHDGFIDGAIRPLGCNHILDTKWD